MSRCRSHLPLPLRCYHNDDARYGGNSPVVQGSVILDLHRMNKIVEINEEYAYAIVEPGVTFFNLYEEIKRRGLGLWPSAPSLGWGSIIGNCLERGFGYTPDGEHSQSQCGMEVVLPNGELVRTGMGAMDGSSLSALYKGYKISVNLKRFILDIQSTSDSEADTLSLEDLDQASMVCSFSPILE